MKMCGGVGEAGGARCGGAGRGGVAAFTRRGTRGRGVGGAALDV